MLSLGEKMLVNGAITKGTETNKRERMTESLMNPPDRLDPAMPEADFWLLTQHPFHPLTI